MTTTFRVNTIDPTRTLTLRHRFVMAMRGRFARLLADIKKEVVDFDALGLAVSSGPSLRTGGNLTLEAGTPPGQYDFPRAPERINQFVDWLHEKNEEYLLTKGESGLLSFASQGIATADDNWMNVYIDSGYQRGIRRARQELKKAAAAKTDINVDTGHEAIVAAFNAPMHAERVGMIYSRAYTSLQGITASMESTVADVLALGISRGLHPMQMARTINHAITGQEEDFGITDSLGRYIPARRRAEMLARTEVIRAHHSANIGEYKAAQIAGVRVLAEHLTAGNNVCARCARREGKKYSLVEAEVMIPVHPNCRCVAIPWIDENKETIKGQEELSPKSAFAFDIAKKLGAKYNDESGNYIASIGIPAGRRTKEQLAALDGLLTSIDELVERVPVLEGHNGVKYTKGAIEDLKKSKVGGVVMFDKHGNPAAAISIDKAGKDYAHVNLLGSYMKGGGQSAMYRGIQMSESLGSNGAIRLYAIGDVGTLSSYDRMGFIEFPGGVDGRDLFLTRDNAKVFAKKYEDRWGK